MADLFTLDPLTLSTVQNGIDSLIHQLGKNCKLVYEAEKQVCNNCIFDTSTQRSSNIYNGVGPKPFQGGKCPVCHGLGFLSGTQTSEEVIQLLLDWQPKPWQVMADLGNQIQIPAGLLYTKGFVSDMGKMLQAKYLIADYQNANFASNRFVKFGEPIPVGNIVKNRYCSCYWTRYGG